MVCLYLLGNGRLFPLHAVHDEDRYIRAVCVPPAIYLAMVDRDVFVKRIVFLEPRKRGPDTGLMHLEKMPNICSARLARATLRDVDILDSY